MSEINYDFDFLFNLIFKGIMYFDRFDIVEAHYAHAVDWHGGMRSKLYEKIGRISQYFKPSYSWSGFDSLSDNGKEIYLALEIKHNN